MQLSLWDSILYMFFDWITRNTYIGVDKNIDKEKRHGVFQGTDSQGNHVMLPFVAVNPEPLKRPNTFTVYSILMQIEQLGFVPQYLEIAYGGRRYMYKAWCRIPIFIQVN